MAKPIDNDNVDAQVDVDINADVNADEGHTHPKKRTVTREVPADKDLVEINWFKKNLLSRKFIVASILLIIVTVFFALGLISFDDWADFCKWIFGIYAVGNAAEHVGGTVGSTTKPG